MVDFWEKEYAEGNQVNRYPFSSLVSEVSRHKDIFPETKTAIEFGSGAGNNLHFLSTVFDEVIGLEKSQSAIEISRELHLDNKQIRSLRADLLEIKTDELPKSDLIVDRATLMTLSPEQFVIVLGKAFEILKQGGVLLSEGVYAADSDSYEKLGHQPPQNQGLFAGKPPSRIMTELENLGFEVVMMSDISETVLHPFQREISRTYRFVAKKPGKN